MWFLVVLISLFLVPLLDFSIFEGIITSSNCSPPAFLRLQGDHHAFLQPGKEEDLNGFTRVIYVPTAKEKPLEVCFCHGCGFGAI